MTTPLSIYYNPTAGAGRAQRIYKELSKIDFQLAANDILVIGGDGTFNTLLNSLPHPEKHRFILLPAGTSNSLCSQISPNITPLDKLKQYLDNPTFRTIDLPELTCSNKTYRFINEASVGFAASIAREIEHRSTKRFFNALHLNELAYIATAFRCWSKEAPIMLSLCNNRRISGNLFPCVNALLDDQLIDIFHLDCPRHKLPFELLKLVKAKKDQATPYVTRSQATEMSWTFDQPLPVEIDGNPVGAHQHVHLSLYPHQIQVL